MTDIPVPPKRLILFPAPGLTAPPESPVKVSSVPVGMRESVIVWDPGFPTELTEIPSPTKLILPDRSGIIDPPELPVMVKAKGLTIEAVKVLVRGLPVNFIVVPSPIRFMLLADEGETAPPEFPVMVAT
jgi:hypothetical protein